MKNMKKIFSVVMIITLATYSLMSGISAEAATNGIIKSQIKVMGLNAAYKYNSKIKFSLVATNYTRKVKYKVSIYNLDTKKTIDLTKGFSKSMGGSKSLTLSVSPKDSGKYSIKIYVKALASKASYDNYSEKNFVIEANKTAIVSQIKYAQALAQSMTVGNKIGNVMDKDMASYKMVINAVNAVNNNSYSKQSEVNLSVKALITATSNFKNSVIEPVDKTSLVKAIKVAQQTLKDAVIGSLPLQTQTGQVSSDDKIAMIKAITNGTTVAVDSYATAEKVTTAIDQLNQAVAAFGNKI